MAKLFSELTRKQVEKAVYKFSPALFDFLNRFSQSDLAIISKDDFSCLEEDGRMHVAELAYTCLCAFKKLNDINQVTIIHPNHIEIIISYVRKKLYNTTYIDEESSRVFHQVFERTYKSFAISLIMLYLQKYDGTLSKFSYLKNSFNSFSNVRYDFIIEDELLGDLHELAWGNRIWLLTKVEGFFLEESINNKLKDRDKAKVVISWENLIEYISPTDKDNIDCLNTFLSGLLLEMVKDEKLYAPCLKILIDKVKQIKNPPTQPTIKVDKLSVGENKGTLFGDLIQPASLPPDFEMPF